MRDKELKKILKEFGSQVVPREDWKKFTRDILLSQSGFVPEPKKRELGSIGIYFSVFRRSFQERMIQPVYVLIFILTAVFGSTLIVNSAFYSLPGEHLYTVKIALERTQLAMFRDDVKATEFNIKLAQKRVDELEEIVSGSSEPQKKKVSVGRVVKQFRKEVNSLKEQVNNSELALKESDLGSVFRMAATVDSAVLHLEEALGNEDILFEDIKKDVQQTIADTIKFKVEQFSLSVLADTTLTEEMKNVKNDLADSILSYTEMGTIDKALELLLVLESKEQFSEDESNIAEESKEELPEGQVKGEDFEEDQPKEEIVIVHEEQNTEKPNEDEPENTIKDGIPQSTPEPEI